MTPGPAMKRITATHYWSESHDELLVSILLITCTYFQQFPIQLTGKTFMLLAYLSISCMWAMVRTMKNFITNIMKVYVSKFSSSIEVKLLYFGSNWLTLTMPRLHSCTPRLVDPIPRNSNIFEVLCRSSLIFDFWFTNWTWENETSLIFKLAYYMTDFLLQTWSFERTKNFLTVDSLSSYIKSHILYLEL